MKTLILVLIFLMVGFAQFSFSQQKEFKWRLGASGGYANYYGDLSPHKIDGISNRKANRYLLSYNENYSSNPSYKVYVERQLSRTIGLMLSYGNYHFGMSDRYIQRNGELYVDNANFARGLNFQNHTKDLGLSFVFKTDNDRFLPSNSLIAPYFSIGAGYLRFDVKGDLLDGEGNQYDQNLPGIIHDGVYETSLPEWRTELIGGYDQDAAYVNLGLGFRIKLGKKVELFAQSDFMHTFTDFLDDVSGKYRGQYESEFQAYAAKPGTNVIDPESPFRGNPNGAKDWIIYHGVGLKFNFGASKKTFSAPVLSTYYADNTVSLKEAIQKEQLDTQDSLRKNQTGITNNFFYSINLIEAERLDSLSYATKILAFDQEIQKRETRILESQVSKKRLADISGKFQSQYDSLVSEMRLPPSEKQELIASAEKARFDLRYSIDSIQRRQNEWINEIDSLAELKRNLPLEQRVLVIQNLDSLFQMQVAVSDSISRKATEARETEQKANSIRSEDLQESTFKEDQSAQKANSTSSIDNSSDKRLAQIEEENKYLKSERDRVLREYSDYKKNNKPKKQKPQYIENTKTIQKENTNTAATQEDPQRRKRWWWPFAAAGGVATVVAVTNNNEQNAAIDSAAVAKAFFENEDAVLTFTYAMLGINLGNPIADSDSTDSILPAETLGEKIPAVQFLKSKEILYFKLNQRIPDSSETDKLTSLGEFIMENRDYRLVVTGFADNTGNVTVNLRIAEDRMKAVADYLKKEFGLEDDQLRLESGGQVIRGSRQAANELDRRVEVRLERK
jgi:outer membrane protein OmpA-like peptidoglycan-associated protein